MQKIIFPFLLLISTNIYSQADTSEYEIPAIHIKAIRSDKKSNNSTNILSLKDISHINLGQDIPTLIQELPSINMSSDAGNGIGYSYLYIRGMDAQRIQVNINGVPYNDAESQEVYWVNIPDIMSSADNIEVQRGIGYSAIGGSGIGGTISIKTTKKCKNLFADLSTSFGSFNTWRASANMSTGVLKDGWQVTTRGTWIQSDGFIDRASSRLGSIYLDISKYGKSFSSHLIASYGREKTYQSWYGLYASDYHKGDITKNIAGTDYESKAGSPYDNQTDNYNQNHIQWITNFLWKNPMHQSSLTGYFTKGGGYYEEYKVGENYSNYVPSVTGNGDLVRQLWLDNYLYGANASHIIETNKFTNTSSFSMNNYVGDHFGRLPQLLGSFTGTIPNEFYFNTSKKSDISAFNKFAYRSGKSNFLIDLQIRNVNYAASGTLRNQTSFSFDKNYTFFNPKLGWNYNLNQTEQAHKFYSFIGLSHREPVRGDFLDEESTRKPQPERAYNLEIGYQYINKMASNQIYIPGLKANLFGMYFNDQLIPTGNVNSVGASIRENVAKSYRAGIEAEIQVHLIKSLSFTTTQYLALNKILDYTNYIITYNPDYSVNNNEIILQNFSSTDIAFSPSWISYAELKYDVLMNTSLRIMNKIVSSQFLDNTASDLKSIPLYSFTNISVSQLFTLENRKTLELNLLLNNIFDVNNITRGYTYHSGNTVNADGSITNGTDFNYYFPQAGFNFLMGMRLRL